MQDKNDLGELFKKRLAEAEIAPGNEVWPNIEKTLDKIRRKRLVYYWFFGGLLILVGILSMAYFIHNDSSRKEQLNTSTLKSEKNNSSSKETKISTNETKTHNKDVNNHQHPDNKISSASGTSSTRISTSKTNSINAEQSIKASNLKKVNRISKKNTPKNFSNTTITRKNTKKTLNTDIASISENSKNKTPKNKYNGKKHSLTTTKENQKNNAKIKEQDTIKRTKNILKTRKKSLPKKAKKDTIPSQDKIFHIFPFIGTAIQGNLSKTSAIDARLKNNNTTVSTNLSYGAYLIFVMNNKLSLRVGASYMQTEKTTHNVPILANNTETNFYRNIRFKEKVTYTTFSNMFTETEEIMLTEKLSHFEMPIEASYAIVKNNQFSVNAITGISIRYTSNNSIYAKNVNLPLTLLGSNDSYSDGGLGIHVGLGTYYKINESFQLQFESIFKPQLKFYKNNTGNTPYIFNVQIGVRYRL